MAKVNVIAKALENISEASHSLAVHGASGYSLETSAQDAVFLRALRELVDALEFSDDPDYYDPDNDLIKFLVEGRGRI